MLDTTNKPLRFQASPDTRLLIAEIQKMKVGDTLKFDRVKEIVGRDAHGSFSPLQSALRICRRQHGMEFGSITKVGYKRLNDVEIVASAESDMRRAHRASRRSAERLSRVQNFAALPAEAQAKHNAAMSIVSVIGAVTSKRAVNRIETETAKAHKELPIAGTLKALGLVA